MNNRFNIYAFGAVFVFMAVSIVKTMVSGINTDSVFRVALALFPLFLIFVISSRRYWLAWFLCFWMVNISLPVMLFDSFTLGFIFIVMIIGVYVLERLILQKAFIRLDHWSVWLLLVAGCIVIGRLLMDRPGSARLGGTGGLRHAISYSAAVPLFFLADQLGREPFRPRSVLRVLFGVALVMLLWRVFWRFVSPQEIPFYFGWYEGPLWFLMPLWLATLLKRVRQKQIPILIPVVFCLFLLLLAVLSPFRSRLYFSVSSMAAVFWCFGYRRRLFVGIAIAFCMVIPVLTVMPKQMVPVVARRALSTLLPYDRADVSAMQDRGIAASGEVGWSSEFRRGILDVAVQNIRKNPLLGQGWSFSAEELMWAASFQGVNWAASSLITAGDYHNALVTVAVKCGLPAALVLACGLFILLWHAGMRQYDGDDADFLVLYAGMMGALVAIFGQMLMNGGGQDLQAICAILGFFHGVDDRFHQESSLGDPDAKA
jgi:hypothetical protein